MDWWVILVNLAGWAFVATLAGGYWGFLLVAFACLVAPSLAYGGIPYSPDRLPDVARVAATITLFFAPLWRMSMIIEAIPGMGR